MSDTITIANVSFTIGQTADDRLRRTMHFRNPNDSSYQLTEDETHLLEALGIDKSMADVMRPYMAKFFETLPRCQADTPMMLLKECEIPYYVLWSTKFAGIQSTADRVRKHKQNFATRTDINVAVNGAIINDMKPLKHTRTMLDQIFTLIALDTSAPAVAVPISTSLFSFLQPTKETQVHHKLSVTSAVDADNIQRIFTLIEVE